MQKMQADFVIREQEEKELPNFSFCHAYHSFL
jgi:hypothetical protein